MTDKSLHALIGAALLLSLLGVILLDALKCPVPEILPYVATSAIGALAMAARGSNSDASSDK